MGIEVEETETITDKDLLTEIMETREAIEDGLPIDKLEQLNKKTKKDLGECFSLISEAFKKNDLQSVKQVLVKVQYLDRIADEIHIRLPIKSSVE